jgi:SM-20-related protein
MTYEATHSVSIDNKPLWIFDGLCSSQEAQGIFNGLEASAFKRNEIARPDTKEFRHWAVNLSGAQIQSLPVYNRAISAVQALTGKTYKAYRGYVNHASFGDMLFTHTDCMPGADELTVLVYISPTWDIEWGGETMFFNEHDDCLFACTPKLGRVSIFHGAIKHVGRPPNRICYTPRYTLAFKLELAS